MSAAAEEDLAAERASMANMGNAQAKAKKARDTPLAILKEEIRVGLQQNGTDLEKNKLDKQGDGDQSPITLPEPQQWYRDLFASGGDLYAHFTTGSSKPPLSDFGMACIMGQIDMVTKMLKQVAAPDKQEAMTTMLETRETSLRFSPLLLLVTMGKTLTRVSPANQLAVCKLLLQYGARVDAKDVGGKTVCHYGSGVVATKTTLQMVKYCVQAHASSQFLNQEVELHSLQNSASMNGKKGVTRGYNVDTGRRVVYLLLQGGEISTTPVGIKPENLKLLVSPAPKQLPNLCDVQDRLGGVCLFGVFMNSSRTDVAEYLLDTLGASIDVADWGGYSPKSMSLRPRGQMSAVAPIIMKHMMKEARKAKKAASNSCAQCGGTDNKTLSNCSEW
jgi:hypothetical protein